MHCVDFDLVEAGNLTRQLLYTEDDIGNPKVPVAVERLRRMNSHVHGHRRGEPGRVDAATSPR